ncbi:hypothetical protein OAN99_06630 [Flavobacteriaceae bacterium]|nr:hypothetical protein [Flavobacteriaceae bacterium]
MQKKYFHFLNFPIYIVGIFLCSQLTNAQLLELDFTSEKREESSFRIHFIRFGIVGASSLKHLDLTAEVLKFRYDTKNGLYWVLLSLELKLFGVETRLMH